MKDQGRISGHDDPVSARDHLVGCELDASHEAEDGIAKDDHEDGGKGPEATEQNEGRLVQNDREEDQPAEEVQNEFGDLYEAFDRNLIGDLESRNNDGWIIASTRIFSLGTYLPTLSWWIPHYDDG